jgi:hypothetical protein
VTQWSHCVFSGGAEVALSRHANCPHLVTFTENLGFHDTAPFHLIVTEYFSMFLVSNVAVLRKRREAAAKEQVVQTTAPFGIRNEAVIFKRHNMKMGGGV